MTGVSLATIKKYLGSGRIHPCILLTGSDADVKNQAALWIAKFLLCEKPKADEGCGNCSACHRIEKSVYPDFLLFREDEENSYKVENIRDIIYQMEVAPLEGRGKVCVLEEAHQMNIAASNALLKTLEEPKENRYFILTSSNPGSLLPTILSRSISFHFKPEKEAAVFSEEEATKYETLLSDFKKTKDAKEIIALCEEKESCLRFLQFLQSSIRNKAVKNGSSETALKYEKAVELEGRLRTNANQGLLLESFLLKEFSE